MRVRTTVLALATVVTGCAWFRAQSSSSPPLPDVPTAWGWAVVETDRTAFDGEDVSFRLLIAARDGGIVLDRRFVPNTNVELRALQDCDAGTLLPTVIVDYFPEPPSASDLVKLRADEWFGTEERFFVTMPQKDGGPIADCVDATFRLRPEVA